MTAKEKALDYFNKKYHCSQAGVEYAKANNLFTEFCPRMVANAVDILEEIIRSQELTLTQVVFLAFMMH
ncbi:MAG: hypothetical protein K6G65_02055 [Lachnospiraceae bacterium]|nr:hypothetical protein [Lachnospiraceae bacterium]